MATRSYDDIAEWYDAWVRANSLLDDPFFPTMAPLLGETAGQHILDLACGQGRVARYLAARGNHVVGIDVSRKLLAIARRYESTVPSGAVYLRDDAHTLSSVREAVFDGVVCHMALMDIPDYVSTCRAVSRVMKPGGWFVFSILHPCYNTPMSGESANARGGRCRTVSGYFAEGFWRADDRPGPPGQIGIYHRTLSTYINTLTAARFNLEHVSEPIASATLAEHRPVWQEVPAALIVKCRKRI